MLTPKRATTAARDRNALKVWLVPHLGDVRLVAITPAQVRRVVDAMSARLKPASVRTVFPPLTHVFRPCVSLRVTVDQHAQCRYSICGAIDTSPCVVRRGQKLSPLAKPLPILGGELGRELERVLDHREEQREVDALIGRRVICVDRA